MVPKVLLSGISYRFQALQSLLMIRIFTAVLALHMGTCAWTADRIWTNQGPDNGTVHSLGNGRMLVYETGPNVTTIYPGPYTSPSIYKLLLVDDRPVEVVSERETGSAIWQHSVGVDGTNLGLMTDFVDAELPCLIRHLDLEKRLRFRLELIPDLQVQVVNSAEGGKLMIRMDPGERIYQYYVYPKPLYHQIAWKGNMKVERSKENPDVYHLEIESGETELYFIGGPEFSEVNEHAEGVAEAGYAGLLERTRNWWKQFTQERTDFEELFPDHLPEREKLLRTIDDVSVMIRTQQAAEGAVMAGYPYPLGYVRDQYGVSRGYLALGYVEEAKNILQFYWDVWDKTGEIHCAQGIGVDGIFHIHENDEVESPGYLIMQAFDLLEKTGDQVFVRSIFPMLEWCWEVQKKHLIGNMLPFNGDETYVAGGILPRSALNDGSSEATMLFIDGGEKFLDWIGTQYLWDRNKVESEKELLAAVRKDFRKNFWMDGQLITNNPERASLGEMPQFRHGVCERGGPDCLVYRTYGFGGIDWTQRDAHGRYQCMNCLSLGPLAEGDNTIYKLVSVSLTPLYFQSNLLTTEELKPVVDGIYNSFQETGVLSSRTSAASMDENQRSVGYDYGLVLFAMLQTGSKGSEDVYLKTVEIVDEIGAWSEYYLGSVPSGTRCRPWESAINLEALIEFAKQYTE
ncbi:MAG: hypothetical protein GY790_17675 [Bacteroidetes bacterium]|nr:hypothetical protein [Bacteroidota bacterium]